TAPCRGEVEQDGLLGGEDLGLEVEVVDGEQVFSHAEEGRGSAESYGRKIASTRDPTHVDTLERLRHLSRHRAALVGIARSEGLTAEESLECVQDALVTMLSREESENAVAALKLTVRNAARNFRRRHRRAQPHSEVDDTFASEGENAEALVSHAEDV